jgi:hypothetical protein
MNDVRDSLRKHLAGLDKGDEMIERFAQMKRLVGDMEWMINRNPEPVKGQHKWDRDGERCVKCGAKDWMGGECCLPETKPEPVEPQKLKETGGAGMNGSNQACQATPTQIIRETFLDSNRAKSEGEWWAASTIGELEEKHKRAWDKLEALGTENAGLKKAVEELKGLLSAALCPDCGGSGQYPVFDSNRNAVELVQCQWCWEKNRILKETEASHD